MDIIVDFGWHNTQLPVITLPGELCFQEYLLDAVEQSSPFAMLPFRSGCEVKMGGLRSQDKGCICSQVLKHWETVCGKCVHCYLITQLSYRLPANLKQHDFWAMTLLGIHSYSVLPSTPDACSVLLSLWLFVSHTFCVSLCELMFEHS